MTNLPSSLILIRAKEVDEHNSDFAAELRRVSGCDVKLVVDERSQPSAANHEDIVSLTWPALRGLKLFMPHDVGWRCGDYGLYIAWKAEPHYDYYWIMDDDFRVGGDARTFFQRCNNLTEDFLGVEFKRAARDAYWWPHTIANDATGFLCVFPVLRMSRRAVETCYSKRQEQSRNWNRRLLWPNDEGLVATTIMRERLSGMDFKELDPLIYSRECFSVDGDPIRAVSKEGPPRLLHPVRLVDRSKAVRSRRARLEDAGSFLFRCRVAVMRRINARLPW